MGPWGCSLSFFFFFSSRRRHTRFDCDWSSDVCSSDLFGSSYLPEKPNFYKSKKDAQEAHEAIRPTEVSRAPEDVRKFLDDDVFKLYQLIWQRFVASQILPAVFDQTTIDISAGDYTFRATGSVQKFDAYLRVYQLPEAAADREEEEKGEEGEGRT